MPEPPPCSSTPPRHFHDGERCENLFVLIDSPGQSASAFAHPVRNWIGSNLLAALVQARFDAAGVRAEVVCAGELNNATLMIKASARGPAFEVLLPTLASVQLLAHSTVGWFDFHELVPRFAHPPAQPPRLTMDAVLARVDDNMQALRREFEAVGWKWPIPSFQSHEQA